jgi:IPT/TIG domain.
VTDAGDSCATPIVIPAAGPFPWTRTVNTESATKQSSDPATFTTCPASGTQPLTFGTQPAIWLSFTPATTGTYQFSFCGTRASALLIGYTGANCGPYSTTGFCLSNPPITGQSTDDPAIDCASSGSSKTSVTLTGGTTIRFMLSNFYSADFGPTTLTVTQGSSFSPIVTAVSPAIGSTAGGTVVTITGSGFNTGLSVQIGGTNATNVNVLSANLATAVTPPGVAGVVNAVVKSASGNSALLANAFVYETPPVLPTTPKRRAVKH